MERQKRVLEIILWEQSPERIFAIDQNLHAAAQQEGIRIHLVIMSETPLLGRHKMLDKMPVLEINGLQWRIRPFQAFSKEECAVLLRRVATPLETTPHEK